MHIITTDSNKWCVVFSELSDENKRSLDKYYKSIYPREYVKKLLAAINEIQFEKPRKDSQ